MFTTLFYVTDVILMNVEKVGVKSVTVYWPSDEIFVISLQFQPIKLEQPRASALGWTVSGLAWAAGLAGTVAWCKQW